MKFCPVVPEICRGQVHGPRKEWRKRIIIIIIRNGAKTISLKRCLGDLITRYDYNLTIMESPKLTTDNRFKK
jgi:hypothetical protein